MMKKTTRVAQTDEVLGPAGDEEWTDYLRRGDHVGMRRLRVKELRQKRSLTRAERTFLKEFDADQALLDRAPDEVWKRGFQTAHRGLLLLESLIQHRQDAGGSLENDGALLSAMQCLSMLSADMCQDFIRLAEGGSELACLTVFRDAKTLASAFSRLAIAHPQHFREQAERSLTMPSLRARNPDFTCDAEAIIAAIHLAEKHHASNLHDNRTRMGALCHQYVAEIVDLVEAVRLELKQNGRTDHKYSCLPDLQGNAKAWWKLAIKEWVHREFNSIRKAQRRNPALWQELEKATDHGTDSAKRAAFEKYCFNKLAQIAGKAVNRG